MPVANTSNISTIQILRSYANSTPLTLDDGQLAYSFVSNTLFIGSNTGIKVISNPSTDLRAQEAYNQANAATVLANAAYFHANGAFLKANAGYNQANTGTILAQAAFDKANTGGAITGNVYISNNLSVANTITTNVLNISTNTSNVSLTRGTGITSWNYSGLSKSVSGEESNPNGLFLSPDGLNMYVNGTTGDDVNQYTLSTAFNVSTASFVRLFSTAAQDTGPQDIFFKPDGLTMFIMGGNNDTVYQYTLSSAWDISTASYASKSFSVTTQEATPAGLWFKPDGTVMYIIGTNSDTVFQYNLGTAWDVSTASYASISFSVATQETTPNQVNLSADGTKMWITGTTGDDINEYALGTAWNVSTATFVNNFYVGFQETAPAGMFIDSTADNRVYIVGSTSDTVFQYNTDTNSIAITTDVLTVNNNARIQGNLAVQSAAYVDGSAAIQGALSVGGSTTLSTTSVSAGLTATAGIILDGSATNTIRMGFSQTTGNLFIGGATQTGNITFGYSSVNQTANIANGTTAAGSTKVVNLGTSAGSGSNTRINIGPSTAGANGNVTFNPQTTVAIQNVQTSVSTTTGALTVLGGLGVSGNVYADAIYDGGVEVLSYLQGVDNTQNTRLTVIESTNLSQNVRLDYSNTAITIIQGVDVGQNTRLTVIEGTDVGQNNRMSISDGVNASQNVRLDYSNTAITIIQGTDVSQNARMTIIEGVDVTQNTRLTVIEGTDVSQNARMTISDGVNASQNVRLDYSNTAITIIQGVDVGQNSRMTIADGVDASQNSRLDYSNTALTIAQGVDNSQNVRIDFSNTRMTIIEGTDVSQNARMTIADGVDASQNVRLDYSNTAITIIQGVDVTQNTRLTVIEGTNLSQNVRLDFSNTRMNIIDGVDAGQNARMTIIEGVDVTQNTNISNRLALSGASLQTVTGNVVFGNDVTVTGNLIVLGNTISLNVTSIEVEDTLIQLGIGNYSTDALTIGYVGHYNDGTNAHAGMIRDALTKEFYAFQGYTPEVSGNVINVNAASFTKANIHGNWFKGNLIATTARVGGLDVNSRLDFSNTRMTIIEGVDVTQNTAIAATDNKMQGAYNVANTADVRSVAAYFHANGAFIKANAAFDQANVTIGVDASQNSRMTIIENTDVSQNVRLAFSNTRMDINDGVNVSQNVRLDYSNTALTIAQGVDNSQNVRIDFSNAAITIIQGVDVTQNTRLTVIEGTNASQNVRLDYSNTALTIAQGVDDSQNVRLNFSNTAINQVSSSWTANTVIVANNTGYLANSNMRWNNVQNQLILGISGDTGNLAIGTTTSVAPITVVKTYITPTGGEQFGSWIQTAYGIADTSLKQGLRLNTSTTHTSNTISNAMGALNLMTAGGIGGTTTSLYGYWARNDVTAGAYVTNSYLFFVNDGGNTGNANNQYGYYASNLTKGLLSNYGFYGAVNTGNNAYNLYMAGTAPNYLAGSLTVANNVSSTSNTTGTLVVTGGLGVSGNTFLNNSLAAVTTTTSAVNYVQVTGNTTGNAPTISVQGTDANTDFNIISKGTGVVNLNTGSGTQVRIIDSGGTAVNRIHLQGQATGFLPVIASRGSDTNLGMSYSTQGTGGHDFYTAGTSFTQQFKIAHTASAVNYLTTTGQATGSSPQIYAAGTDGNVGINLATKGTGNYGFFTNTFAQQQFAINHTASAVNYLQVAGNATGQQPYFLSAGSDTNVGITYATKGTGPHFFSTGGGTLYQFEIASTASAVNYVRVTGAATGSHPSVSAQGTDANVGINITPKGNGSANITSTANSTSNTSGALVVTGGIGVTGNVFLSSANNFSPTTSSVSYRLGWSDNYFSRNPQFSGMDFTGGYFNTNNQLITTGALSIRNIVNNDAGNNTIIFSGQSGLLIQNGSSVAVNVGGGAVIGTSSTNYIRVSGGSTPYVISQGAANAPVAFGSNGTGTIYFNTNGGGTTQATITHTASAVNYLQITGATTGNAPSITVEGSDSNIPLNIQAKLAAPINFFTSGGYQQFKINNTATAVNYLQVTGNTTGGGAVLSAQGSDTNVGININPKGAGSVNVTSTTSSTSNTTGALVVNGGLGLTGNLSMNLASSGTAVSRLTLSPQGYFTNFDAAGNIVYNGGSFLFNNSLTYVQNTFIARGPIINDQGNNTILFAGSSPVRIQNTAASTSNTTGSLIVGGGIGVTGNVFLSTANNYYTTTTQASYRLGWSDAYFMREVSNGNMVYNGPYFYINSAAYVNGALYARTTISNDQGNTTVLFGGSSAVKIQNGTASSNTTTGALVVQGGVGISGALNATTKSFNIPHPTKEGKDLRYGSLEGPEFGVYVRGTLKGSDTIELPDYWTKLVDANTITVSLTPIGKHQKLSVKEVKDNTIIINSDGWFRKEIHCYYTVFGERADVDKLDVEG